MSGNEGVGVPKVIRQQELIERVGASLPNEVEGDWVRLEYEARMLSMYAEGIVTVFFSNGEVGSAFPPVSVSEQEEELREIMYIEGAGAWFSAKWTVDRSGDGALRIDARFNYDEEPNWDDDIHPGLYGVDLEDFPRSEDNVPEWLSGLLAEAEKAEAEKKEK